MARDFVDEERTIIEFLLSKPFAGRDELRKQLEHVRVTGPSCTCGCESVALAVDPSVPRAPVDERVPTDAFGRDAHGAEVGVLLHVLDGYMVELEFYSTDDVRGFGRPTIASLRIAEWSEANAENARTLLNPIAPPE